LLADRCALSLALPLHIGQSDRVRGRPLSMSVLALCCLAIAGCSSSFGGSSAEVAQGSCERKQLPAADLPAGLAPTNVGYFAECDALAARTGAPLGTPFRPIEVYDDPVGTNVIAWWYLDCGLPDGIVGPGKARPECASSSVGATTP